MDRNSSTYKNLESAVEDIFANYGNAPKATGAWRKRFGNLYNASETGEVSFFSVTRRIKEIALRSSTEVSQQAVGEVDAIAEIEKDIRADLEKAVVDAMSRLVEIDGRLDELLDDENQATEQALLALYADREAGKLSTSQFTAAIRRLSK